MRLCGHDCVVSGRYDCCFVGPGRRCAGLDPQDALNFGIILLNLSLYAGGRRSPLPVSRESHNQSAFLPDAAPPLVSSVPISRHLSGFLRKTVGFLQSWGSPVI